MTCGCKTNKTTLKVLKVNCKIDCIKPSKLVKCPTKCRSQKTKKAKCAKSTKGCGCSKKCGC